jgi:hypothetical protein
MANTIIQFRLQSKLYRRWFYISCGLLLLVYIVAWIITGKVAPRDIINNLHGEWATIIGIVGSIASTISFFYAITIAYESIISSNQSEEILSQLNAITQQTQDLSTHTNQLVQTISDSTRKCLHGQQEIGEAIVKFLQQAAYHQKLLILTANFDEFIMGKQNNAIIKLIEDRYTDVQQVNIKLLNPKIYEQHCADKWDTAINILPNVTYTNHLPYHLFIKEQANDYSTLIIFDGIHQQLDIKNATALLIDNDEIFCKDMETIFMQLPIVTYN